MLTYYIRGILKNVTPELLSFVLESNARRADTFLLAVSIACGFIVLNKGPLQPGRDLDLTKKYLNNAMIASEH